MPKLEHHTCFPLFFRQRIMNRNLRKAVLAGLGIAALAGVSTQASAISTTNVGGGAGVINSSFLSLTSISGSNVGASGWDG
jgi:uncharacterized protein YraI